MNLARMIMLAVGFIILIAITVLTGGLTLPFLLPVYAYLLRMVGIK